MVFCVVAPDFQSIQEVGGYVLIGINSAPSIPLENLRIIRGHSLYEDKYALAVLLNSNNSIGQGVNQLPLTSLTGMWLYKTVLLCVCLFFRLNGNNKSS